MNSTHLNTINIDILCSFDSEKKPIKLKELGFSESIYLFPILNEIYNGRCFVDYEYKCKENVRYLFLIQRLLPSSDTYNIKKELVQISFDTCVAYVSKNNIDMLGEFLDKIDYTENLSKETIIFLNKYVSRSFQLSSKRLHRFYYHILNYQIDKNY